MGEQAKHTDEAFRESKRRYPQSFATANAFHRAALGWSPPPGVRLTREQREAVSEGSKWRRAAIVAAERGL